MYYFYLISMLVLFIDQVIKQAVVNNMRIGESISILDGIVSWTSHRNRGAAFGILKNQTWFLILVTVIAVVLIIYCLQKIYRNNKWTSFGLSLILGGALGNFFDRIVRGEVVDMIEINFIDYPIFNVADSFIVTGCMFLIIGSWGRSKKERK